MGLDPLVGLLLKIAIPDSILICKMVIDMANLTDMGRMSALQKKYIYTQTTLKFGFYRAEAAWAFAQVKK